MRYRPSKEPANTPELTVGGRVKFPDDRRYWTVRAHSPNFTVLTRQAAFKPSGYLAYTVVDWRSKVRGPIDVIGHSYPVKLDDECLALLAELEAEKWGVSQRAWVYVDVDAIAVHA